MLAKIGMLLISLPDFPLKYRISRELIRASKFVQTSYGPWIKTEVDDSTNWFAITGSYGKFIVNHLRDMPENAIFIDIGANLGIFSIIAAETLKNGIVVALEPNPKIFSTLIENINKNKLQNIIAFNIGIGADTKIAKLSYSHTHSGLSSIQEQQGRMEMCAYLL